MNTMELDMNKLLDNKYTICRGILNSDTINRILNGSVNWNFKLSNKRSKNKVWNGCMNITSNDIRHFGKVVLPSGRIDINLPIELVNAFGLDDEYLLKSFCS